MFRSSRSLMLSTAVLVPLGACAGETQAEAPAVEAEAPAKAEPAAPPIAADAKAEVGEAAPDFTLADLDGESHTLSDYAGKVVVLEWFNPGCPFVVHAHGEGPLQQKASTWTDKGVVWLAVNSGAPGKQGHGVDTNKDAVEEWSMGHPVLVDETGAVGKAYDAKTTPHMYVIDPEGTLVYAGGLDNAPLGKVKGGGDVVPYVDQALGAVLEGREVPVPKTQPYGCSVKYGS